jgi:hypothetical protein
MKKTKQDDSLSNFLKEIHDLGRALPEDLKLKLPRIIGAAVRRAQAISTVFCLDMVYCLIELTAK